MARLIRLRAAWIAGAVIILAAAGGAGVGVYIHLRPQPQAHTTLQPVAKPSIGSTTVTQAKAVEVLSVLSTLPAAGASGQPVNTSITMRFNLPIDPAGASTFFSVLPNADGKFAAGSSPQEIVFTPAVPFPSGAAIKVLLRRGFPSLSGELLDSDFSFNFNTAVSSRDVAFTTGGQFARVYGAASGSTVNVVPQFGDQVPSDVKADIFKATVADVLAAQVHDPNGTYLDRPIDHSRMPQISEQAIANGQSLKVSEPDGIYLVLAADLNGQFGAMWIDFSKYGVLLREDDQKIVVAGENLSNGDTSPTFTIGFYSLNEAVQLNHPSSFSGTGEFVVGQSPIDVAVASSGGEDVIVPVGAPQTAADIKVVDILDITPQLFITTDRTGYQANDTVKFAGVVRYSHDQAYTVPVGAAVWVWTPANPAGLFVSPAADGTFSGSFPMPATAFNSDGSDAQLTIYAGSSAAHVAGYSQFFTVVAALGPHSPVTQLKVAFDKTTYVASDTIQATISGPPSKSVSVNIFATANPTRPAELPNFLQASTWGAPVQQNITVNLDATGHAIYSFKANLPGQAADQQVTLEATYGTGAAQAVGARTAVVYQAADEAFFLPARSVYLSGDTIVAPFVIESTDGQRVPSASTSYELDKTDYQGSTATTTVVSAGTATTDGDGRGVVHAQYTGPAQSLTLRVKGKDSAGNAFGAALPVAVMSDTSGFVQFGQSDNLVQLSILEDKIAYTSGDTAHLTVTSPATLTALMSLERGRIHSYRWVQLAAGDNAMSLPITSDLFPGFTLTFSYFRNGVYYTEGMPVNVTGSTKVLKVTVTPDQKSYTKGQTAHVAVAVTDSAGAPVAAALTVDGYDAAMSAYKLVDRSSVAGAFYTPTARATNGSSSLLAIGSWGGRCGGGMQPPQAPVTNAGTTAVWLPDAATDATGHISIDVPIGSGPVRLFLVGSTADTLLGQAQIDLSVQ